MRTETVRFHSEGLALSGRLHVPDGDGAHPVVVQGCGWMEACCSDVSEPFHRGLVAGGYAVLQFDNRGWGDSEGERSRIEPYDQVTDLVNAVRYVTTRSDLDPGRVGIFGLGGTGAGNAVYAAAECPEVRCIVLQNVVATGVEWFRRMRREYEWLEFKERVATNRVRAACGGEDELVDPTEDLMVGTPARRAAGMPTYGRQFALSSAESLMAFRPIDAVARVSPKALLIACIEDDPVTPIGHALTMYEAAGPPKCLVRQSGVSTYEAYTVNYDRLMRSFLDWYGRYLG
ncbi:MAG: peptidase S15 [Streptosporangiales bacterium]|nr:peptidase S15 [Streptosporangiales bacterium]